MHQRLSDDQRIANAVTMSACKEFLDQVWKMAGFVRSIRHHQPPSIP